MIDGDVGCLEIQEPFLSYEYEGERDKDERKGGVGIHIWTSTKVKQKYEGDFFQNTLHGFGDLLTEKHFRYTGHFFANCYEGYGRIKYFNGNIFEGLFKDNQKFGPGVFTYNFGAQDVGFWSSGSLIRLCFNHYLDLIPQITRSYSGKKYIQNLKTVITFQYPPFEKAKEILRELNVDESDSIVERKDELYNSFLGQKHSVAFNNNKFEEIYFSPHVCEDNTKTIESTSLSNESGKTWEEYCPLKGLFTNEMLLLETKEQIELVDVLIYYLQLQKRNIDLKSVRNSYEGYEEEEYVDDYNEEYGDSDNEYLLEKMMEEHHWLKGSLENIEITLQGSGLSNFQKKYFESFENSNESLQRIKNLLLLLEQLKEDLTNKYEELATNRNGKRKLVETTCRENIEVQSWNNNQWIINMVAHCYRYKQKEDALSFHISDFNNRLNFSICGPHESDCLCFLLQCAFGDPVDVVDLCKRNLNLNVSSCTGNSGVFYAVAFGNVKVLKTLAELGADLDIYNDECLTPLTLALCCLLTFLRNVTDWEKAFLFSGGSTASKQREATKNINEWHFQIEKTGNSKFILPPNIESKILDNAQIFNRNSAVPQEFIFSTECRRVSLEKIKRTEKKMKKTKKGKSDKGTRKAKEKGIKKGNRDRESKQEKTKIDRDNKQEKTKSITPEKKEEIESLKDTEGLIKIQHAKDTVWTLLDLGANSDFGTVPLPPLILSIFIKCEVLVKELLTRGNPDVRTFVDNLSSVHVLCCLPFHEDYLKIFKIFVLDTNLNLRTGTGHWKKEKELIMSTEKYSTELDEGKTALHILCMRYDFEGRERMQWKMFELLWNGGADTNLTYLGHTSLTLAMLRGNLFLVEEILKHRFVNPNQLLREGMGVPLTMLLLKRYKDYLPANLCMRFVDLLMKYNANPFDKFSVYGNAVEFLEKEYQSFVTKTKGSKKNKSKSKQTKGKKKKKKDSFKVLFNHFLTSSRNFLLRHIQAKAVEYLYWFISETCIEETYLFYLAKFVNTDEAVQNLQLLVQNRIIVPHENFLNTCRDVLNFIRNTDFPGRDITSSSLLVKQVPVEAMLTIFSTKRNVYVDKKYHAYPPELDKNVDKYIVCYQCCKSVGKELIPCPFCWIVYFCSEACNKSSLQASSKHKCRSLFYAAEKIRLQENEIQTLRYYTPLQEKFDWIKQQIRKRKFREMLKHRFAKEWDLIYGCRPKVTLEFERAKMKFINDRLCSFYKNNPDASTDCIHNNFS